MWDVRDVQTFFPSRHAKYFAVLDRIAINSVSATRSLRTILDINRAQDEEMRIRDNVVHKQSNWRTESNLWLRRTGWIEICEGKDMTILLNYSSSKGEDRSDKAIVLAVRRMIKKCVDGVKDLEKRGWTSIRFWLQSLETERPNQKPFKMHYSDLQNYTNIWIELVLFCWRSYNDIDGVQLDRDQTHMLEQLRNLTDDQGEETEDDHISCDIDKVLFEFYLSLL